VLDPNWLANLPRPEAVPSVPSHVLQPQAWIPYFDGPVWPKRQAGAKKPETVLGAYPMPTGSIDVYPCRLGPIRRIACPRDFVLFHTGPLESPVTVERLEGSVTYKLKTLRINDNQYGQNDELGCKILFPRRWGIDLPDGSTITRLLHQKTKPGWILLRLVPETQLGIHPIVDLVFAPDGRSALVFRWDQPRPRWEEY
jgi:hypothetical protein